MTPLGGRSRGPLEERGGRAVRGGNGLRADRSAPEPGVRSADGGPGVGPVPVDAEATDPDGPRLSSDAPAERSSDAPEGGRNARPSARRAAPQPRGDAGSRSRPPAVDLVVSVVVLTIRSGHLAVLLAESGEPGAKAEPTWTLPGGPVESSEDLDAAARRHLDAAIGGAASSAHLEQLRTWSPPPAAEKFGAEEFGAADATGRRLVRVGYLALLAPAPTGRAGAGPISCRFWPVSDLSTAEAPARPAPDDLVIAEGVERARAKLEYTPLATAFVEEPFTLADLRRIYEAVWGQPVQPANFRRRVLSIEGFVVPLGRATASHPAGSRPADLYGRGPARLLHPALLRPSIARESEIESDDDL